MGLARTLVACGSVCKSRTGALLGPLVRRIPRDVARLIGEVSNVVGFAVVDFCFLGPSTNGTSPHFGSSQPLRQIYLK